MLNANRPDSLLDGLSSGCVSLHREGRGKRLLFRLRETESEVGAAASEEGRECLRSRATEFRAEKHFITSTFQKILQKFRNRIS